VEGEERRNEKEGREEDKTSYAISFAVFFRKNIAAKIHVLMTCGLKGISVHYGPKLPFRFQPPVTFNV
jgi:hypothetical protein